MTLFNAGEASRHQPSTPSLRATISSLPRRVNHGGAAWLRRRGEELRQPQDGVRDAPDARIVEPIGGSRQLPAQFGCLEGDDASITGGTRSLVRRLMGLNVTAPTAGQAQEVADLTRLLPRRTATV